MRRFLAGVCAVFWYGIALAYPMVHGPKPINASAPTIRAVAAASSAINAITPALPTGNERGDLLIMFCKTQNQTITVAGWTEAPSSPSSNNDRVTVFYRTSTGSDATTTSDSGQENTCFIIGITKDTYDPRNPFNASVASSDSSCGSLSMTGPTTTVPNTLILAINAASAPDANSTNAEYSAWTNANLASITEQFDQSWTTSNGGSLGLVSGTLATAGAVGATTATVNLGTACSAIVYAIAPS